MMSKFNEQTLLVTGASGHFGRIAIETLLEKGATRIIAGTRDPAGLAELAARGVTVRKLDFDDAASLGAAFAGVDRVLLISTDAVGRREQQHRAAIKAAEAAGVKHIVYTSAPAARPNIGSGLLPEHYWSEQALAATGMDWTSLRVHIYAEAMLMGAVPAVKSGQWFDATGNRARTFVSRVDAARTAVGALLSAEGKAIYDVTGPETITQAEVVALLSEIAGKPVTRVGLGRDDLQAGIVAAGFSAQMADILVAFDLDTADGYHGVVTNTVEHFSGRAPLGIEAFLRANAAAFQG